MGSAIGQLIAALFILKLYLANQKRYGPAEARFGVRAAAYSP